MRHIVFCLFILSASFSPVVKANEWIRDVQVMQISGYAQGLTHYVWFSSGSLASCEATNPQVAVWNFSEQDPGGKTLLAMLMIAVTTKSKVDVQVNGCSIYEIYLR